jgi:hypothetical protein
VLADSRAEKMVITDSAQGRLKQLKNRPPLCRSVTIIPRIRVDVRRARTVAVNVTDQPHRQNHVEGYVLRILHTLDKTALCRLSDCVWQHSVAYEAASLNIEAGVQDEMHHEHRISMQVGGADVYCDSTSRVREIFTRRRGVT